MHPRLLIVDDDADMREALDAVFSGSGSCVRACG
jgi:hypothetical protein